MTLQDLLEMTVPSTDKDGNEIQVTPEFRVSVQKNFTIGGVHFIIHADGHNSETLDFVVSGNNLEPL